MFTRSETGTFAIADAGYGTSISFRSRLEGGSRESQRASLSLGDKRTGGSNVRIAVIRLPRIANFTDFELLEQYAAVDYVQPGASLEGYDCVIIPGTKNTIDDLRALREAGTDRELVRVRNAGVPVIGICGGYQMLGSTLVDAGFE